jgi:hypothetical protein
MISFWVENEAQILPLVPTLDYSVSDDIGNAEVRNQND